MPDAILLKPGRLTAAELAHVRMRFDPRLVDLFVSKVVGELPWVDDLLRPRESMGVAS